MMNCITKFIIHHSSFIIHPMRKYQSWLTIVLVAAILLIINILATFFNAHVDLTEEKRFTLTQPTVQQLKGLDETVFVRVLLEGKFPASFKRLRNATQELLADFHNINPKLDFQFEDPALGTVTEMNDRRKALSEIGIRPVNLRLMDNDQKSERLIYPFAVLNYKNRTMTVNLLESDVPGMPKEVILNNSVSLLEYKFSNAIQKLLSNDKPNIVFTKGHGELQPGETADLEQNLRQFYDTGRIDLDSTYMLPANKTGDSLRGSKIDVLVVAKPKTAFSEKHKFLIDQYVMNGGRVIWLIDKLNASTDAMQQTGKQIPVEYPLNLEDQFFKYGFKINSNLVADMQCGKIELAIGREGNVDQREKFRWYYLPVVAPNESHPVVKGLSALQLQYPSNIDTTSRVKTPVKRNVLLRSSVHSRLQFAPTELTFDILRYQQQEQPEKFNQGNQPLALMLEGQFPSLYENRVSQEMAAGLQQLKTDFKPSSVATKMLVVADGDIARNEFDPRTNKIMPLGYSKIENFKFANKDFLLNAIEYMSDDKGIIQARTKDIKLRMLDVVRAKKDGLFYQFVNIVLPLAMLGIFGMIYFWWRRRRFAM
jgi:ABC-2 type transport system permease protein